MKKRRWSWLWAALVVSLALNLAVIAAIVTHKAKGRGHHRITGPGFTQVLPRAFFRQLDKDRRDELVSELRQHRKEFRGLRQQLRQRAREIAAALRAGPYDAAAVDAALVAYDEASTAMVGRGRIIASEFFTRLTAEERKLMADEIGRKSMSRRKWRKLVRERSN
jgi:uncharacterized membrane protein